jgi:acetyl esterase/lipase
MKTTSMIQSEICRIHCCTVSWLLLGSAFSCLAQADTTPPLSLEQETVPLWTDKELGNTQAENSEKRNERGPNDSSVSNINRPTLTVYHPTSMKNTGTGIVICPGGGYGSVVIDKEGHDVARWLTSQGVTAGVLKYRCGGGPNLHPVPMIDARRAIQVLRSHSNDWKIVPDRIGIMGFSAGGHLAATIATDPDTDVNFAALIYPVISMADSITHPGSKKNLLGASPADSLVHQMSRDEQVTSSTCPVFLVHASDGKAVSIENSLRFYQACIAKGVPAEMHLYPNGGHGFGLFRGRRPSEEWPDQMKSWMTSNGWCEPVSRTIELPRDMTEQLPANATDQQVVEHLIAVRKASGISRALSIHLADLDRVKAYRIQMALLAKMESAGERLVGWKMGGTKIAKFLMGSRSCLSCTNWA